MLRTRVWLLAIAALISWSLSGIAEAQENKARDPAKPGTAEVDKKSDRTDESSQGMAHRASTIQGLSVENEAKKQLGTVQDIVIDVRAGQVKYAALSYGGFLGLGDKLFAVPWDAFGHRHDADNDKHVLVLNIDEQSLKSAPGFDENHWPDFATAEFNMQMEKHYGPFRKRSEGREKANGAEVNVEARPGDTKVEIDIARKPDKTDREPADSTSTKDVTHRASKIVGMTVKNAAGNDLGSINDLVIDMDTGDVRYAAVSYGGLAGLGDKLFAVPWQAFNCQYDPSGKEYYLVLDVDEATLRKAPGFDQDNWPNLADPKFHTMIHEHYGPARPVGGAIERPN